MVVAVYVGCVEVGSGRRLHRVGGCKKLRSVEVSGCADCIEVGGAVRLR